MTVTMYKTSILVITMLLILSLAAPVMANGELSVTREISDQTVAPGSNFTVTLTVTANTEVIAPTVREDIPVGTVTVIDSDGMMYKASTDEWILLEKMSAEESKTVIYEVTVPEDAETQEYNITGTGSAYNVAPSEIGGDGEVTLLLKTANIDGNDDVDFYDAIHLARYTIYGGQDYPLHAYGDVDSSGDVDFDDAIYLARYTIYGEQYYPLYP